MFGSTEMMIRGRSFDSAMESLEGMIASWAADIHYDAADTLSREMEQEQEETELKDYDSPTKVNEDGEAIALAKELGRQTARENAVLDDLKSMMK